MEGNSHMLGAVVLGACTGSAAYGDGQATWLWEVTTQNGDSVVESGETALITLSLLMESETYMMDQIAIAEVVFDTLGGDGAGLGGILDWDVLNILDNLWGDQTTTDGVSLFNTTAAQIDGQGPYVDDNPVDVLEFEWAPLVAGTYTVDYETFSHGMGPGHEHMVVVAIEQGPGGYDRYETWPVTEAAISFEVVPSPATLGIAALSLIAAARRRSRGENQAA